MEKKITVTKEYHGIKEWYRVRVDGEHKESFMDEVDAYEYAYRLLKMLEGNVTKTETILELTAIISELELSEG